ncbi:MAG: metalloregulator ArsR/SmtB family transcription factor [Spirochaetes bacterium]|jgi:ArsR family transcriptional regulator|nr:metalloregulator ArsR/SmtB family transcription factor [Spirochaetota bacterium]
MSPAEILKALGDETRLRAACLLTTGELCVCDIESCLGTSQSNLSRHLAKLKNSGLIASRKRAQWVYYRLADGITAEYPEILAILRRLSDGRTPFKHDHAKLLARRREKNNCIVTKTRRKP